MMRSIFGIVLVLMLTIPAIAAEQTSLTAAQGTDLLKKVDDLGKKVDDLGKQLEKAGTEVSTKLTSIETNTKSLDLQGKVDALGKQFEKGSSEVVSKLTNIEANTKATFSTTFWVLVVAAILAGVVLIAGLFGLTSNRLDRAAINMERVMQTVTAPRERPSIMNIAPVAGLAGSQITIRGAYFQRGMDVEIDGIVVPAKFESDRLLTAQTPLNQTPGVVHEVRVINPDGRMALSPVRFTYQ